MLLHNVKSCSDKQTLFFFSVHQDTIQKPQGSRPARDVLLEVGALSGIVHQYSVYLAR